MSIELIIRPFSSPDVSLPRIVRPATATALTPNVHLKIGRSGGTKTLSSSYSHSSTVYVKKWPKETDTANT